MDKVRVIIPVEKSFAGVTEIWLLYLTTTRIIVSRFFRGGAFAYTKYLEKIRNEINEMKKPSKLKNINPEEILKRDKDSYYIPYLEMEKFEIKKFFRKIKIVIKTRKRKYRFTVAKDFYQENPRNEIVEEIKRSLPFLLI